MVWVSANLDMGSSQGKPMEACGPIVDDMKKTYGLDAVKFLRYWHDQFEFPENGSLSESKIKDLEERLNENRRRKFKKKTIKCETLILMDDMQRVLQMWIAEAENRRRKTEKKKKSKDKDNTYTVAPATLVPHVQAPPPKPPTNVVVVDSRGCYEQSPQLLPPLEAGQLPPRLVPSSTGGRERAAAGQALEAGVEEKPCSPGSTGTRLQARLQTIPTIPSRNIKALSAAPMVEPANLIGTIEDMKNAMKHLPSITSNGEKFAKDFLVFCKVLMPTIPQVKYLLISHFGPVQYLKIKEKIGDDCRPMNPEWEHKANILYREAITHLCDAIRQAFPKKVDFQLVSSTGQQEGETPIEFLSRLQAIFDENVDIPKPDEYPGPALSPYESFLVHSFLRELLPQVMEGVEATCIYPYSARLQMVTCHAMHAYQCQQEAIRKKAKQREEKLHRAIVAWSQWGRGGRGGHGKGRRRQDGCFVCGAYDHWMRDCPQNAGRRSRRQGRAIGNV